MESIESALLRKRLRRAKCLPRFRPVGWWECDVFELTKAGFFVEYEIKQQRHDLLVLDPMKKTGGEWIYKYDTDSWHQTPSVTKHELLARGCHQGPSKFWFVTPPNMVGLDEIPEWAGLIEMDFGKDGWYRSEKVIREPQKLHNQKADISIREQIMNASYWRFHTARDQLETAISNYECLKIEFDQLQYNYSLTTK